jgi:hypothetical protein
MKLRKRLRSTTDKASDQISQKALRAAIKKVLQKNFAPWDPTEREKALVKIATGLETAAQGVRELLKSEYLQAK